MLSHNSYLYYVLDEVVKPGPAVITPLSGTNDMNVMPELQRRQAVI